MPVYTIFCSSLREFGLGSHILNRRIRVKIPRECCRSACVHIEHILESDINGLEDK